MTGKDQHHNRHRVWWISILLAGLILPITDAQASWWNPNFDVTIETTTNGIDADRSPGPELLSGAPIIWTYTVINTGRSTLNQVEVYDLSLIHI